MGYDEFRIHKIIPMYPVYHEMCKSSAYGADFRTDPFLALYYGIITQNHDLN